MTPALDGLDVVIIGGGPAGMSAALVLGRCRRRVVVFDSGEYRNAASHAMHGFLTRDGIDPSELRRLSREQLARYESVSVRDGTVLDARAVDGGFEVATVHGQPLRTRKLIIATGIVDELPSAPGARELYGTSIFHCPYCDGWEVKDQPIAIYGRGDHKGGGLALALTQWTHNVVLCTDGPSGLSEEYRAKLERNHIPVFDTPIVRFDGSSPGVRIRFADGDSLEKRAIFFNTSSKQRSDLARRLGCELDEKGGVKVGRYESTTVPGLYVAGDASRDVLQTIVGAAEGAEAAIAINTALLKEDLR